ncbi:MAG: type II secretion system protein GspE [Actinobacteria bacterium HGW-Actinobacteria-7]|nr:MAG: type II secretion system protein GspE [Actinobacteria bacterium HGW-Actinobacteria-7]
MTYTRERLGELLVSAGLIDQACLSRALTEQQASGGKLGEVLVKDLCVTEEQIAGTLAGQKGLTHVNLTSYPIDRVVATMLPVRMVRKRLVMPLAIVDGALVLAMADPLDVEAIDEAELRTGMKIEPVVAAASQVRFAIEKYVAGADVLQELELVERRADELADNAEVAADADVAVVRMVNQLLREAVLEKASDIHFEPTADSVRVRYRIDGVLRDAANLPKKSQAELLSRVKVMADMDITERRRPQDGRFGILVEGKPLDFRAATLPTPLGEAITLRILDSEVAFRTLEEVGLSEGSALIVKRMLSRPYGALFISGPTGSGKSTTLYALMNEVNIPARKVVSVEDPVEYRMAGVTQIAVNSRIGLTFAAGLRSILRSDPDVVMVGEVRDPETAETAVRAALTGHLVLTSIHTNDAPSALTRLTDMGVPAYITSAGLVGAVAQRLVRKLCPHCKVEDRVTKARLVCAGYDKAELGGLTIYKAAGCDECSNTGYKGRVGCFEVLEFDDELHSLFLRNSSSGELRAAALERGMRSLRRDALDKAAAGITSLDEVDRVAI